MVPCTFVEDLKKKTCSIISTDLKTNYQIRIAKVGMVAYICNLIKKQRLATSLRLA